MKKTLIAIAVAATIPGLASAADLSGYADINYISAGAKQGDSTGKANQFGAMTEVNIRSTVDKVTFGADVDLDLTANGSKHTVDSKGNVVAGANSANVEQAFFALKATDALTVIGGVFNNPINYEHQDSVSRIMNSQGQILKLFDDQTALYGNNVAGVAGAMNMGMATVTVAVLDQLNHDLTGKGKDAQNSFAAQVALVPMDGLTVKAGMVTQNKNYAKSPTSTLAGGINVGNVWDVNAEFKAAGLTAALEIAGAEEVVDTAYALYARYDVTQDIALGLRHDDVSYQIKGVDNTTSTSLNAAYSLAKNLKAAVEYRTDDNGTNTDDSVRVKFLAKF